MDVIVVVVQPAPLMSWTLSLVLITIGLLLSAVSVASMGRYVYLTNKDPLSDRADKYMMGYFVALCLGVIPVLAGVGGVVENAGSAWYLLLILAYAVLYFGSMIGIDRILSRKA